MAESLNDFKQDTKQKEYELGGKIFTANFTGASLLEIIEAQTNFTKDNSLKNLSIGIFKAVFGAEATETLLNELNLEGINLLMEDIMNVIGGQTPS